jgi:hypothetical protein
MPGRRRGATGGVARLGSSRQLAVPGIALVAWLLAVGAGHGQELSLQTELDLRMTEAKSQDGQTAAAVRIAPRYQLTWRGPLRGGTNVLVDLGAGGSLLRDPEVSSSEQDVRLDLRAPGQVLSVDAALSRSSDRLTVLSAAGGSQTATSRADTFSINSTLSYPAYPLVSVQYQRTATSFGAAQSTESTSTRLGANYDWSPLRFSVDESRQQGAAATPSYLSRQYGVTLNTSLTSAARLSVDHFQSSSELHGTETSQTMSRSTTARLSALPTPFLVLDAELTDTSSSQDGLGAGGSSGLTHMLALRSDPLPGVRLDLMERGQRGRSGSWTSTSQEQTMNLAVQLPPSTTLVAILSQSRFSVSGGGSDSRQRQQQISFSTPLFGQTDLQASYNRNSRSHDNSEEASTSLSAGLFGELTPGLTANATYRYDRQESVRQGAAIRDVTQSLQVEADWSPSPIWDLTLGVTAVRTDGSRRSSTLAPSVDARWNMDPSTTLTVRYNLQRLRDQGNPSDSPPRVFAGGFSFLNARLIHDLREDESIELSLDTQASSGGALSWERALGLHWTKRL